MAWVLVRYICTSVCPASQEERTGGRTADSADWDFMPRAEKAGDMPSLSLIRPGVGVQYPCRFRRSRSCLEYQEEEDVEVGKL